MKKEFLVLLSVIVNNEFKWNGHVTKIQNECHSRAQIVSRQKLNSNRENIVLYSINLDVFSIAIEFLTTNDLDSVCTCSEDCDMFSPMHHYLRYYQYWTGSEFVRDSRSTVMNNYLQMIQSDMTITAPSQQTNR